MKFIDQLKLVIMFFQTIKSQHKYIVILAIVLFFQNSAFTQSPKVSIQGTLKDAKGAAAATGTYTITFRLYTTPVGGLALWSETASVDVVGGIYSHYLGSIVPLNPTNFNNPLFLGVQVGNIELSPRTELTYAPYAFAVNEVICSGAVGDLKYSILNPVQFVQANGNCWIPMDGRNIAGSALANIMSLNNVPDGSGAFLRIQEFDGGADNDPDRSHISPIATIQNSNVKPHNHTVSETPHSHSYNDRKRAIRNRETFAGSFPSNSPCADDSTTAVSETTSTATMGATVNASGGTESRPINHNFWIYVRIN
jgi:hypothetical protein